MPTLQPTTFTQLIPAKITRYKLKYCTTNVLRGVLQLTYTP